MSNLITPEAERRSTAATLSCLVAQCNHTRAAHTAQVERLLHKLTDSTQDVVVTQRNQQSSLGVVEHYDGFFRVRHHTFTPDKVSHITQVNGYININII